MLESRPDAFSLERQPIRLVPSQDKAKLVGAHADVAGYVLRRAGLEERAKSCAWCMAATCWLASPSGSCRC